MKILLTGATGFLGSLVLRGLLREHHEVCIIKRSLSNTNRIQDVLDQVKAYDIDKITSEKIIQENRDTQAVIHLATNYGRGDASYESLIFANIIFPISLLDALAKNNMRVLFLNADTFYTKTQFFYSYLAHYTLSKRHCLEWLKLFSAKMAIANLRIEHVYGTGDANNKFAQTILMQLLARKDYIDLTDGKNKRDFIYADDVVQAFLAVLRKPALETTGFKEYEVGTGTAVSLKEFVTEMQRIVDGDTKLNFGKLPHREGEIPVSQADTAALRELGWEPQYSFKSGLIKFVNYYKQ